MEEYHFSPISAEDFDEVSKIYRENFEDARWTDAFFKKALTDPDTVGIKLVDEGRIAGMLLATKGIFLTHMNKAVYSRILDVVKDKSVYTAGMIYVIPKLRCGGIGIALFYEILRELKAKKVDLMLCEMASDSNHKYPGESVLRSNVPYLLIGEYKNYYHDIPVEQAKPCLACGKNPCVCSAKFYLFEV